MQKNTFTPNSVLYFPYDIFPTDYFLYLCFPLMFTGIIEALGKIREIRTAKETKTFLIEAPFHKEVYIGQSIAHNGICLTVEEIFGEMYQITAINETLAKTTMNSWKEGDKVNLERALPANGRIDGHFVQGHIDTTTELMEINGNFYTFRLPEPYASLVISKGSIAIDGVGLTVAQLQKNSFSVALIPHTLGNTVFKNYETGSKVNLEFDVLGKYIARLTHLKT